MIILGLSNLLFSNFIEVMEFLNKKLEISAPYMEIAKHYGFVYGVNLKSQHELLVFYKNPFENVKSLSFTLDEPIPEQLIMMDRSAAKILHESIIKYYGPRYLDTLGFEPFAASLIPEVVNAIMILGNDGFNTKLISREIIDRSWYTIGTLSEVYEELL